MSTRPSVAHESRITLSEDGSRARTECHGARTMIIHGCRSRTIPIWVKAQLLCKPEDGREHLEHQGANLCAGMSTSTRVIVSVTITGANPDMAAGLQ